VVVALNKREAGVVDGMGDGDEKLNGKGVVVVAVVVVVVDSGDADADQGNGDGEAGLSAKGIGVEGREKDGGGRTVEAGENEVGVTDGEKEKVEVSGCMSSMWAVNMVEKISVENGLPGEIGTNGSCP
jgi:hypothetical protein